METSHPTTNQPNPTSDQVAPSRRLIRSLKVRKAAQRTVAERVADGLTGRFGSLPFLAINLAVFAAWIGINLEFLPGFAPFDPFPFGLLTMIVSLEAIILSVFVLISQNRAERVDDLREEVDLQIDLITEKETTKMLELLSRLAQKLNVDVTADQELRGMTKPTDTGRIERQLEKQLL